MPIAKHALAATVAILYAPLGAQAQVELPSPPPQTVEWSTARKLSRDDFKKDVPNTAKYQSRSWIRIEASWRCISDVLNTTISAVFDPARSWWLGSQWNPWEDVDSRRKWLSRSRADFENKRHIALSEADLLRHEQLHFDLAELTAARIRRRLSELKGHCARPHRDAVVETIVLELTDALGREQTLYDEETAHGTRPQVQQQWEKRVERAFRPILAVR